MFDSISWMSRLRFEIDFLDRGERVEQRFIAALLLGCHLILRGLAIGLCLGRFFLLGRRGGL